MHPLISLAKSAVENYIKEEKIIEPPRSLPVKFYERKAGAFVTIEKDGQLRACIGTYLPTRPNIAQEVIRNAIAAAKEDYRFGPIQPAELPYLSYTIYILAYPEPVKNQKELNHEKFGIIVKTGPLAFPNKKNAVFDGIAPYKTGLLLPDLPGIDTAEKQLSLACQKGGIDPEKEKIFIYRFSAEKYHE